MARTRRTTIDPPAPPAAVDLTDVEVYEPDVEPPTASERPTIAVGGKRRGLKASLPGAIAGTFLVCALAFGASLQASSNAGAGTPTDGAVANVDGAGAGGAALGDTGPDQGSDVDGVHPGGDAAEQPSSMDGSEPTGDEPTGDAPDGESADGDATPAPEPTPTPDPKPVGLDLARGDGGSVRLDWNACPVDGLTAWKVIRSTDEHATYPRGAGDSLVGVTDPGHTAFTDTSAPAGKTLWYAVFAVAGDGDGRYIACASPVRRIETPRDEPTEPTPTTEPTDPPANEPPAMGITLVVKEGAIYVDWTGCEVAGAEVYKVVRSSDETVRWPLGDGDTLAAVVEVGGKTAAWDEHAPAGKRAWYRVFCVRHTEDGYKVLNMTPVRSITAPSAPAPEVQAMSIEAGVDEGHAVLHWEACTGESFSHYRILRRTGDSTTVVKEIENAATTSWMDPASEAGVTYQYLVQCKGHSGDTYVLLGTTGWTSVTVE